MATDIIDIIMDFLDQILPGLMSVFSGVYVASKKTSKDYILWYTISRFKKTKKTLLITEVVEIY